MRYAGKRSSFRFGILWNWNGVRTFDGSLWFLCVYHGEYGVLETVSKTAYELNGDPLTCA